MVTWQELASRLNAGEDKRTELERCVDLATVLVDLAFATAWRAVPALVLDECVLRAGEALFKVSGSSDAGMYAGADGSAATPVANDPLRKCWPLIRKYVMPL